MDIKAFVLSDNSRLEPIPSEDRSPEWLRDEVPRWIDVEAPEANKLMELLAPLGIPQPIIESCLKPSEEPELDDQYSYFIILGLMFVIASVMLFFFNLRGWFK